MKFLNPIPTAHLPADISQYFGQHGADYGQFGLIGHTGLDIAMPEGTETVSAIDGWIIEAVAKDTGFGLRISIFSQLSDDRAVMTVYGHFKSVPFPDLPWVSYTNFYHPVKAGDLIGHVDSTGFSTGNHLHFGAYPLVKRNGVWQKEFERNGYGGAINPLSFIQIKGMANLYIDNRTTPPTIIIGDKIDLPENLKWITSQHGVVLPLKVDGSVDWESVPYAGQIVDK